MNRALAAASLGGRFLRAVVVSGAQTVRVILVAGRPGGVAPPTGFVRLPIAPMTPQGTALLACLVSLTPGTSVIEVDGDSHSLVLHMLDLGAAQATLQSVRRDFEPGLLAWFAKEPA
jgi:multisubunit Na+/H+ antiporter MnhE subunit